jgi:hypothetical protein
MLIHPKSGKIPGAKLRRCSMKLVYSSSSLNKKINQKGEEQIRIQSDPTSIEDLMMQIEYLTQRVKQLEIDQAWSQKI